MCLKGSGFSSRFEPRSAIDVWDGGLPDQAVMKPELRILDRNTAPKRKHATLPIFEVRTLFFPSGKSIGFGFGSRILTWLWCPSSEFQWLRRVAGVNVGSYSSFGNPCGLCHRSGLMGTLCLTGQRSSQMWWRGCTDFWCFQAYFLRFSLQNDGIRKNTATTWGLKSATRFAYDDPSDTYSPNHRSNFISVARHGSYAPCFIFQAFFCPENLSYPVTSCNMYTHIDIHICI